MSTPTTQITTPNLINVSTPASTSTITAQDRKNSSDLSNLNKLEKAISQLIQDCIKLTDWSNCDQVFKHKNLLFNRILIAIHTKFSGLGINTSCLNQILLQQKSQKQQQQENNIEQQQTGICNDGQSYQYNTNNNYGRDTSQNNRQNGVSSNQKPKHSQQSQENYRGETDSEYFDESSSGGGGDGYNPHRHKRISKHNSYKYQQRQDRPPINGFLEKPRRGGLGIPGLSQSASINSYPMEEKKRVLEFYNERYDPTKRNKIELIELMVQEFGYSKSSLYYLVTNQKMFEAVQRQLEMAQQNNSNHHHQQSHQHHNNYPIYSTHQQPIGYSNPSQPKSYPQSTSYGSSNQYSRDDSRYKTPKFEQQGNNQLNNSLNSGNNKYTIDNYFQRKQDSNSNNEQQQLKNGNNSNNNNNNNNQESNKPN